MLTGSCFCKKIRIEITGQPITSVSAIRTPSHTTFTDQNDVRQALCYCTDCRKLSGGTNTYSFLINSDDLKVVEGNPKEVAKVADSGSDVKNWFCSDCGMYTTMFFEGREREI